MRRMGVRAWGVKGRPVRKDRPTPALSMSSYEASESMLSDLSQERNSSGKSDLFPFYLFFFYFNFYFDFGSEAKASSFEYK